MALGEKKKKTSDHQNIIFQLKKRTKRLEKKQRRFKTPKNRKHLGSDIEIQNFPKRKKNIKNNFRKKQKNTKIKSVERKNFISSFLGKRRKNKENQFRHDNMRTNKAKGRKNNIGTAFGE